MDWHISVCLQDIKMRFELLVILAFVANVSLVKSWPKFGTCGKFHIVLIDDIRKLVYIYIYHMCALSSPALAFEKVFSTV